MSRTREFQVMQKSRIPCRSIQAKNQELLRVRVGRKKGRLEAA